MAINQLFSNLYMLRLISEASLYDLYCPSAHQPYPSTSLSRLAFSLAIIGSIFTSWIRKQTSDLIAAVLLEGLTQFMTQSPSLESFRFLTLFRLVNQYSNVR